MGLPRPTWREFAETAVGVPFEWRGRSAATGWDCWGLCVAGHAAVAGVDLDALVAYRDAPTHREIAQLVDETRFGSEAFELVRDSRRADGDIALIWRRGRLLHCGLVLAGWGVLHVELSVATVVEPFGSFRIEGYYRPVAEIVTALRAPKRRFAARSGRTA